MTNSVAPFFYCPTHQVRFRPASETTIQCEQGPHEVGNGFPVQSWWAYCCDCATFWPADFTGGTGSVKQCLVCDRWIEKYFVCAGCQVISIKSSKAVPHRTYSIDKHGIRPNCPACRTAGPQHASEHQCDETGFIFLTARAVCAFCQAEPKAATSQNISKATCWSCDTALVAPFKFCKRCGSAQDQTSAPSPISAIAKTQTSTEEDVLDLHHIEAGTDFEEEDSSDFEDTGDTEDTLDVSENTETPEDFEDEKDDAPYSLPWQTLPLVTRKRRRPWLIPLIAICVCAAVLLPVFTLYGDRKASSDSRPITEAAKAPPGMVYIAGGEFLMGTDDGDEYERPAHPVTVAPFYMDATEVTCEQYQEFVRSSGHRAPRGWTKGACPPNAARLPVAGVDWYDASAYAKWAEKRLPTEEEWEFAARSSDGRRYPWGNTWVRGAANAGDSSAQQLINVGSLPSGKTPSGLMDLAGNAWEWTSSDLSAYPNGKLSEKPTGEIKVIRGGSWQGTTSQITTTYRGYLLASGADDYSATGFRCVRNVDPQPFSKEN